MDEHREFHLLHLPYLINFVVPVVQLKTGRIEIGSGVLVRADGRHFIATAKHCIDGTKVRVVRSVVPLQLQEAGISSTRELSIRKTGWHDTLDLGYVEIEDPECPELAWDQFCHERITGGLVQFVGYPEVLTIPVESITGRLTDVSLCAGTFGTTLVEETDDCMAFDYPKVGSKYDEATGTWNDNPFPETPRGFSGGGCFGVAKSEGEITRVEYLLLGIQHAWNKTRRVVLVTPIKRWSELLVERGLV
jgi:hypothetical protein